MSGIYKIADERQRQVRQFGFTDEHNDQHRRGEQIRAAMAYCATALRQYDEDMAEAAYEELWPASWGMWAPSDDPIWDLTRAGALIASEIDRIQRCRDDELDDFDPPPGAPVPTAIKFSSSADDRCGVCWGDTPSPAQHICALTPGHEGPHRCVCTQSAKSSYDHIKA